MPDPNQPKRIITQSGMHVYSNGRLVGSYRSENEAKKAAADYGMGPGNIVGSTSGQEYRDTQLSQGMKSQLAANDRRRSGITAEQEAFQAQQTGLGAPQSLNAQAALEQGVETPEQTMARIRAQLASQGELTGIERQQAIESQAAPSVFTSEQADQQNADNIAAYDRAQADLAASLDQGEKPAPAPTSQMEASTTPTETGEQTQYQQFQNELNQINAERQTQLDEYNKQVENIMNGTFDMSPAEKAQLQDIQNMIDRQREEMNKLNAAQLGAVKVLGIRSGRQRYAGEIDIGNIGAEISSGAKRIRDIEQTGVQLLNAAKVAMQDKRMDLLDDAMKNFNETVNARQSAVQDMYDNLMKYDALALQKNRELREQMKEDAASMEKAIQASREGTILGLVQQGITDPIQLMNYANYDDQGNQVGDITFKEISDTLAALNKAKTQPDRFSTIGGPGEGLYQVEYNDDGSIKDVMEILRPRPKVTEDEGEELLTPSEAAALGVSYGTTKGQAAAMGISPTGEMTTAQLKSFEGITTRYQADQILQNVQTAEVGAAIADQVIANPGSAANQLKALYTLVKGLDPDSAVREGEISLAEKTQSYIEKWQTSLERVNAGKILSEDVATDLANATKELFGVWKQVGDRRTNAYKSQAQGLNIGDQFNEYLGGFSQTGSGLQGTSNLKSNYESFAEERGWTSSYDDMLKAYGSEENLRNALEEQGATFSQDLSMSGNGSIGQLSAAYEGSGDPGQIGYDSTGGWSYGTYQLAHENAKKFIDQSKYRDEFRGLTFNSEAWKNKWKEVAKKDPDGFKQTQHEYIGQTHYAPQIKKLAGAGINENTLSPALRDVIWSTAVQHGANTNIVINALKSLPSNATDEQKIRAIYKNRWAGGKQFASSAKSVKNAVYNRFFGPSGEMNRALSMARSTSSNIG